MKEGSYVYLKQSVVDLALNNSNNFPDHDLGFPYPMRKSIIQAGTNKSLKVAAKSFRLSGCYQIVFDSLTTYTIPREYLTIATISKKE